MAFCVERKLLRSFIVSAGILLLATGLMKLVTSIGQAPLLTKPDPIFGITFRRLFWFVGAFEMGVALSCFINNRPIFQASLVAWLSSGFGVYRLGLLWIGYRKPCPCMGNFTDTLHIAPQTADVAMRIVLSYLLVGSYCVLCWLWNQKRKSRLTVSGPLDTMQRTP